MTRRRSAHSKVVRRQAERDQVLVAGIGRVVGELGWQIGQEPQLGGPGLEEVVQHVRMLVPQEVAESGQERVGVSHLRRPATVPGERLVGCGRERGGVAFQQGHTMALATQHQRGGEPGDAGARNDDLSHDARWGREPSTKS